MSVYLVVQIDIRDRAGYELYVEMSHPTLVDIDYKVLALDDHAEVLEGEWPATRTALIEFPDQEAFRKWWDLPAYREAAEVRLAATRCNTALIHGRE